MRKMRKFLNILFLCTLALGLSSCEPDDGEDYYIYDTLLGGIWVGDLGFADAYNSPLESGLYFEGNGLGKDEQAYYNDPYGDCLLYTSDAARRTLGCRSRWSPYH